MLRLATHLSDPNAGSFHPCPVLALVIGFVVLVAGRQAILPVIFPTLKGIGGLNVRQYPRSEIAAITVNTRIEAAGVACYYRSVGCSSHPGRASSKSPFP
jgi:hypothetical protein